MESSVLAPSNRSHPHHPKPIHGIVRPLILNNANPPSSAYAEGAVTDQDHSEKQRAQRQNLNNDTNSNNDDNSNSSAALSSIRPGVYKETPGRGLVRNNTNCSNRFSKPPADDTEQQSTFHANKENVSPFCELQEHKHEHEEAFCELQEHEHQDRRRRIYPEPTAHKEANENPLSPPHHPKRKRLTIAFAGGHTYPKRTTNCSNAFAFRNGIPDCPPAFGNASTVDAFPPAFENAPTVDAERSTFHANKENVSPFCELQEHEHEEAFGELQEHNHEVEAFWQENEDLRHELEEVIWQEHDPTDEELLDEDENVFHHQWLSINFPCKDGECKTVKYADVLVMGIGNEPVSKDVRSYLKGGVNEGKMIVHATPEVNLYGRPQNKLLDHEFDFEHGILVEGIHPVCNATHDGPRPMHGAWGTPGCRSGSSIQHVVNTKKYVLEESDGKVALILIPITSEEFQKFRRFNSGSHWCQSVHPAYSKDTIFVDPDYGIIVDPKEVPLALKDLDGPLDIVPLMTEDEKKASRKALAKKYYNSDKGKATREAHYNSE